MGNKLQNKFLELSTQNFNASVLFCEVNSLKLVYRNKLMQTKRNSRNFIVAIPVRNP